MSMSPELQRVLADMRNGKPQAALANARRIVNQHPHDLDAMQILALVLVQSGQLLEALPLLARAVVAQPLALQYRNNYANVLLQLKRVPEAVDQWEQTVQLDPRYAMGWLGLASARIHLPDLQGALDAARQGIKLRPGWREITRPLVIALEGLGRLQEAVAVCHQTLDRDPLDFDLRSLLLLLLNYQSLSPDLIANEHREYGRLQLPASQPARTNPQPERRLRVGILSGDLRTHSVAFFAEPLLRHLPSHADLTVFSLNECPDDAMARRLRSLVHNWEETGPQDDKSLAKTIRSGKIDVLIELQGHTPGNRLSALASKPAPVIISAIGYPNTTGASAVDWRLVDSITDPPGSEHLCTERLMRLDPCFLCYSPPVDAPEPVFPPATEAVTFGSFNSLSKISDQTLELWSQVLRAVPGSNLLIKAIAIEDTSAKSCLSNRLLEAGIPFSQFEFLHYSRTIQEHLRLFSRIHVALDTFPYNGTTTTCDALWMGVPVVTLCGDRHAARVGASLLGAIGHSELVAPSPELYVATAVRLANSRELLQEYRNGLRTAMIHSPLNDPAEYAERFFAAMQDCWRDWCKVQR